MAVYDIKSLKVNISTNILTAKNMYRSIYLSEIQV